MTTQLAVVPPTAPVRWSEMDEEQKALIKQVCASSQLNDAEFALLVEAAIRSGLDVLRKQIYGLKFRGRMTVMTGIDGFRAVARRNGLAGVDDAIHTYAEEDKAQRFPLTSTVSVYRYGPNGEREKYTATARFHEYAQKKDGRPVDNWLTKPHVMLDKCAEALAHRKAFTESLAGIYERAEFANEDPAMRVSGNVPIPLDEIEAGVIDTTAASHEYTTADVPGPTDEDLR